MKTGLLGVLAAALLVAGAQAGEVHVTGGTIRGQELSDGSAIYRAVPYAAPPLGDLRWKPPAPVIPWKGVRNAVNAPRACLQLNEDWNAQDASAGSEDCLYLSIHTPKHKKGAKLPVLVWIHGGSNRAGSGFGTTNSPLYKHGIVEVGIEYRLGLFGFLASPELTAESPHHSSGGYALLDQIAALAWVRDNIAAFGGDPANVTIGGQSAGGIDIGQLMRSPLAHGLFAKAIQESGTIGAPRTAAQNEKIGSDLMALLHLPAGPQGLAALRAMPAATLMAMSRKLVSPPPQSDYDTLWVGATADGWILSGNNNNVYLSGDEAHVPLLIGNVTQEFIADLPPDATRAMILNIYKQNGERALALYGFNGDTPPPPDPVLGTVATQALDDMIFRCPSNQIASWEVAAGQNTWRYEFGVARPGMNHVEHTAELDYVFAPTPAGATFGAWPPVQRYWANFMKTGDPNGPGLPTWPQAGKDMAYLAFTPNGPVAGTDLRGPLCRLLADTLTHPAN